MKTQAAKNRKISVIVLTITFAGFGGNSLCFGNVSENVNLPINISESKVRAIISEARSYIGVPYLYGGETRAGIDCSALTKAVLYSEGIYVPRISKEQAEQGIYVSISDLQVGDLVFFKRYSYSEISHCGIISRIASDGDVFMIHASSGSGVIEENYTNYTALIKATQRRVLNYSGTVSFENNAVQRMYPQASSRLLTKSELLQYSKWQLSVMRNELFAVRGYEFHVNISIKNHFESQSWYNAISSKTSSSDLVYSWFSEVEKANCELIKAVESKK